MGIHSGVVDEVADVRFPNLQARAAPPNRSLVVAAVHIRPHCRRMVLLASAISWNNEHPASGRNFRKKYRGVSVENLSRDPENYLTPDPKKACKISPWSVY
jgi:hypothetical protein